MLALHGAVLAALFAAQYVLPAYHQSSFAHIMVLATYALGYNLLLGYTGLMSLGHAMFFAAGVYGAGLPVYYGGLGALPAFASGVVAAAMLGLVFGLIALRTRGVSFLIVTLMFAQAFQLSLLYFNRYTQGDQGFTLERHLSSIDLGGLSFVIAHRAVKYDAAFVLFAAALVLCVLVVRSPFGRVLVGLRENEERTRLLGYNTHLYRLLALVLSAAISGAAGAAYALLFSYVGSSFAGILYSIYPLLWTLLGGAGTSLGPLVGTGLMYYLVDIASGYTDSYLFVVGAALLVLVLWMPRGIMGAVRRRWLAWLP